MGISAAYLTVEAESERGPWVQVLPDLRFPRYATVTVTDDDRSAVDAELRLVFDPEAARYVVDSMVVTRKSPASQVDGTSLRTIPVQEYMRSLEWAAQIDSTGEPVPSEFPEDAAELIKRQGPGDAEGLRWIARVYVVAQALSRPPAKAVQDAFHMPAPTASVWIRRARDRGFLPDVARDPDAHMTEADFEAAKSALRDG